MLSPLLLELFYETHVVFIEKSDVVDSVFEHGYTLNAHTESETGVLFGINAAYLENGGMYHSTAQDLDPAGSLAYSASLASALEAGHVHFS